MAIRYRRSAISSTMWRLSPVELIFKKRSSMETIRQTASGRSSACLGDLGHPLPPRCSRPCGSSERRSPGRPINRPGPLEPATECATSAAQQDPGPSGGDVGSHAGQPRDVGSPRASVPCRSCPATPVQGNRPSLGAQRGSQRSIVQCRSPPPALVASARFAVRPAMWREQPTTTLMLAAAVAPRADGVCALRRGGCFGGS